MTTKAKKAAAPQVTANTKLTFATPRPGKGTKTDFLALVPKKGSITVAKLKELGKSELELSAERADKWVNDFVKYGRVKVV